MQMYQSYPIEIRQWIDPTAAGKSSGCWNTGRCTIASFGRWATRNASEGYVLPKNARPNSARLNEIVG